MAVALGLLAALVWGGTDLLIQRIGRSYGIRRAMLYAQGFGAVSLGAWVLADPRLLAVLHAAPAAAWRAALAIGAIGVVASCAGYYALRIGRVGVVAPVVGAYGAVTAVLSWLGGERMSGLAAAGLAFTVAGVVLVSVPPAARAHPARGTASGLLPALAACTGYGLQFWIQGRFAMPLLGAVLPVWMYYAFSTAVLAVVAAATRPPLLLPARDVAVILGTAALAVGGFVIVSAGLATGHVAVVVVLSSLQSAISVGLACLIQGERLARHQWLGVAAVVAGLALVRAG